VGRTLGLLWSTHVDMYVSMYPCIFVYMYLYSRTVHTTKGTRAHTHRELILFTYKPSLSYLSLTSVFLLSTGLVAAGRTLGLLRSTHALFASLIVVGSLTLLAAWLAWPPSGIFSSPSPPGTGGSTQAASGEGSPIKEIAPWVPWALCTAGGLQLVAAISGALGFRWRRSDLIWAFGGALAISVGGLVAVAAATTDFAALLQDNTTEGGAGGGAGAGNNTSGGNNTGGGTSGDTSGEAGSGDAGGAINSPPPSIPSPPAIFRPPVAPPPWRPPASSDSTYNYNLDYSAPMLLGSVAVTGALLNIAAAACAILVYLCLRPSNGGGNSGRGNTGGGGKRGAAVAAAGARGRAGGSGAGGARRRPYEITPRSALGAGAL